jgi:hypothetical protein
MFVWMIPIPDRAASCREDTDHFRKATLGRTESHYAYGDGIGPGLGASKPRNHNHNNDMAQPAQPTQPAQLFATAKQGPGRVVVANHADSQPPFTTFTTFGARRWAFYSLTVFITSVNARCKTRIATSTDPDAAFSAHHYSWSPSPRHPHRDSLLPQAR